MTPGWAEIVRMAVMVCAAFLAGYEVKHRARGKKTRLTVLNQAKHMLESDEKIDLLEYKLVKQLRVFNERIDAVAKGEYERGFEDGAAETIARTTVLGVEVELGDGLPRRVK